MDLIKLKEVAMEFGKRRVLHNVNLTINEGDAIGIIGQSGSGKTTLLNLIAGFLKPSEGNVSYVSKVDQKEKEIHRNLHKIKRHIGFTPQHNSFYHRLTVKENLLHFGKLYGVPKKTLNENVKSLLKFTKLYNHQNVLAQHLSGGMQKRLDISCSLVHRPKLLILDEPTADLDPQMQNEVLYLLKEANRQGISLIIASHHHDGVEQICNKVAIIHNKTIHSAGEIEKIRQPYLRDSFRITLKAGQHKDKLIEQLHRLPINKIIDNGHSITIHPRDIGSTMNGLFGVIKNQQMHLHDIDMRGPSLTEIFETITEK